jgi:alkylhydroperoxidase family enzyme
MNASVVRAILNGARALRRRWLAFAFARKFYAQACASDPAAVNAPPAVPSTDVTDCLLRRSLPSRIHVLAQLRIASQIASIDETRLQAQMCRDAGWSEAQIGAALLGNPNGSFSDAEKLVLQYAEDMTRTPIDVDPQVVKQLSLYFSRPDLIELTAAIAHENFRIRLAEAHGKLLAGTHPIR